MVSAQVAARLYSRLGPWRLLAGGLLAVTAGKQLRDAGATSTVSARGD